LAGDVKGTVARFGLAGKMPNDDDFLCTPSVPACDYPGRGLALLSLHFQLRDVEELLAGRGLNISYETVTR
jgi:hypothetical protein